MSKFKICSQEEWISSQIKYNSFIKSKKFSIKFNFNKYRQNELITCGKPPRPTLTHNKNVE